MMARMSSECSIITIALTIVIVGLSMVAAIPLDKRPTVVEQPADEYRADQIDQHDKDPMMAMPTTTSQQAHISSASSPYQNQVTEIQYIHYAPQPDNSQAAEYHHHHQQQQPQAYQPDSQNPSQESHHHGDGVICSVKHQPQEYIITAQQDSQTAEPGSGAEAQPPSGEYPGQIVYVNPDGQQVVVEPQLTGPQTSSMEQSHQGVVDALDQNPGLSATILTEIPIKDMPLNVLEKLKRDFGVKVVATRERPGANLVINCDEHSNKDNSICSRGASVQYQTQYELTEQPEQAPGQMNNGDGQFEPGYTQAGQTRSQSAEMPRMPQAMPVGSNADESSTLVEAHDEHEQQQRRRPAPQGQQFEHREYIYTVPAASTAEPDQAYQYEPNSGDESQDGANNDQEGLVEERRIHGHATSSPVASYDLAAAGEPGNDTTTEHTGPASQSGDIKTRSQQQQNAEAGANNRYMREPEQQQQQHYEPSRGQSSANERQQAEQADQHSGFEEHSRDHAESQAEHNNDHHHHHH